MIIALIPINLLVRVQPNDQVIPLLPRVLQEVEVPHVEQIERADHVHHLVHFTLIFSATTRSKMYEHKLVIYITSASSLTHGNEFFFDSLE